MSIASFREVFGFQVLLWIVFIHVVWGRPGGLLQFSKMEAVKIFLASVWSGIHAMWPNRETWSGGHKFTKHSSAIQEKNTTAKVAINHKTEKSYSNIKSWLQYLLFGGI